MVSKPPHPTQPNYHLSVPWDRGLFFDSQVPGTGWSCWAPRGDASLVTNLFLDPRHKKTLRLLPFAPAWLRAVTVPWVGLMALLRERGKPGPFL